MAHVMTHDSGHRPHHATDWKAGAWAGAIAGVVFVVGEMLGVMLFQGESPWAPPRMIAAMVLGQGILEGPPAFDPRIMTAAMGVHFALSIVYGLFLGWAIHRLELGAALAVGVAFGIVVYLINFYPVANALFPWFAMARGMFSAVMHVVFGVVLAGAYIGLRRK